MAKYDIQKASNGATVYVKKPSKLKSFIDKRRAQNMVNNNPNANNVVAQEIQTKKSDYETANNTWKDIMKQHSDPNTVIPKGDQKKGTVWHNKQMIKNMNKAEKDLNRLGVKVKSGSRFMKKTQYVEGGNIDMLNVNDIKKMKLDVFEDASKGKISDNMKVYLITYFEGVQEWLERRSESYAFIESQRDDFTAFVLEAMNNGYITTKQGEVMLELAEEDDILFESEDADIPALVRSFLEAAAEGDEGKKEEIKGKIEDAKNGNSSTPCENFSVSAKLEELAINLTDEEKAIVAKIDEKIKSSCGVKEEPVEKNPTEGNETVKESVERFFEGVDPKFSFSATREEMSDYLTESVENGLYTSEDARRIMRAIEKTGC